MDSSVETNSLNLQGGSGSDTLTGDSGQDRLTGGAGADCLDGGAGSDTLNGGSGNDTLIYNVSANSIGGTTDIYTGGSGKDTVILEFTRAQWLLPQTQSQITAYLAHLAAVTNSKTGEVSNAIASDFVFTFGSSRLTVQMMEIVRVFVDGTELTAANDLVSASDDTATVTEDGPGCDVYILANDLAPDLVSSVLLTTAPGNGSATLVMPDGDDPATWHFRYEPTVTSYQYLAAGETATDTFAYKVIDANGDEDIATVTVTITGTNDTPVVAVADVTGAVTEAVTPVGNLTDSGTISFTDVDLSDVHTVSAVTPSAGALGTLTASITTDTTGSGLGGVLSWNYSVAAAAAEYLAAGQTQVQTFSFDLLDGNGGSVSRTVSVTITGTNDAPVVAVADVTGAVTEALTPVGNLTDSGTISFTDVDLSDVHTVSAVTPSAGALGTLTASITTDTTGSGLGGVLTWNYSVAAAAAEYLAAGETKVQTFSFDLLDGHGGSVNRTVSVTITGTNDAPVIAVLAGDSAATTLVETDAGLFATDTLTVNDGDTLDTVSSIVTGVTLSGTTGGLTAADVQAFLTLAPATGLAANSGDTGNLAWTFDSGSQAFDYLGAGQSLSLGYTITSSDGNGGADTQVVTVTIDGTTDASITDLVLTPVAPSGNNLPNGTIGQLSAIGAVGSVSYTASVVEKLLNGTVDTAVSADITVSASGALSAAPAFAAGRIYEVSVKATDSVVIDFEEMFRVISGTSGADNIISLETTSEDSVAFLIGGGDIILAGSGDDTVFGQNADDRLHGGDGMDTLFGGGGADRFYFEDALGATNVDQIRDFEASNTDRIMLDDAIFSGIGTGGTLTANNFISVNGTGATATLANNDINIVYDSSDGHLYYDPTGLAADDRQLFAIATLVGGTFDRTDIEVF